MPGNHRREMILHRHQLINVCAQRAVGGISGTPRPDTAFEDVEPLLPTRVQDMGDLARCLAVLLGPDIKDVLIGLRPPTRVEHQPDMQGSGVVD
ncbi:hypothetical protein [Mycobacterium ulcerans]|uniref:hypothetical protein n=1 Tax=Mycobacterium ulcerans TaxID=1809 RepID=UPI003B9678A4